MQLDDSQENSFKVEIGDGIQEPNVYVELAAAISATEAAKYGVMPMNVNTVISNPMMQPFLFILHGDGRATEVIFEYLRRSKT